MEQSKDLKYIVGVEQVQHLLAVYGIDDCEPSGDNHLAIITTSPHTLSKIINVGFARVVNTQKMAFSKENHDEYEELLESKVMYDFLKSCLGKEITLKEQKQSTQQGKKIIPKQITIRNKKLQNRLLSALEYVLSGANDVDLLIAKNIDNNPSMNEELGFYAWWIIKHCFAGYDFQSLFDNKKYKSRLYSFIYDLFFKAGLVFRDDCKHEGYENGGREKWQQVKDWIEKSFLRKTPLKNT